jgi:hypothetical protein
VVGESGKKRKKKFCDLVFETRIPMAQVTEYLGHRLKNPEFEKLTLNTFF